MNSSNSPEKNVFIDTHCHLTSGHLAANVAGYLSECGNEGVALCLTAASDVADSIAAMGLARRNKCIYYSVGIHPHEAAKVNADYIDRLAELAVLEKDKCAAVGEIGLDYHYDFSPRDAQRRVFAQQLELSARLGLPIIVHCREAFDETHAMLADYSGKISGVIHSFTGGPKECEKYLAQGWHVSFSGIVTFKRSEENRQAAKIVPADKLLIETDSPYLSPVPFRGKFPNSPARVIHVGRCIADARGEDISQIAAQTTQNACELFKMDIQTAGD